MSKDIYINTGVTACNKSYSNGEIYENDMNLETQWKRKNQNPEYSEHKSAWSRCYRLTTVCLVLMCVLLLTGVTVLWIKYNNMTKVNNQLQTRYNNLSVEQDQLQTRYNNLSVEHDQLQTRYNNLSVEHDQLQTRYNNLSVERNQFFGLLVKLGTKVFNSSIYWISTATSRWDRSREDCRVRGADLVIINSREEQEFISKNFVGTEAWIGLTDIETQGIFRWVDGTLLTTAFWWTGEPSNNLGIEDCVGTGYINAKSNMSTWNDYPCNMDRSLVGICEMKIII